MQSSEPAQTRRGGVLVRGARYFTSAAPWPVWTALGATWVVMVIGTLKTKSQYLPDSRYYVAMTYRMLGSSPESARAKVAVLDKAQGWETPPLDLLFNWGLVQPRVLYSALSAPFVKVLGVQGMVVVPVVSMALLTFVGFAFIAKRLGVTAALVPVGLLTVSSYMMFFGTAMVTEGLSALIGLAIVMTLPLQRERSRFALILSGVLVVALAFTRQAWMIPAAAVGAAWLGAAITERKLKNRWLPYVFVVGLAGVVSQVIQTLAFPSFSVVTQFKLMTGEDTLWGAVGQLPAVAARIVRVDLLNYVAHDRPLLVLLCTAFVAALVCWRTVESHLYMGMIVAGAALNVLNGTPTAFRYQMPGLAFVLLVAAVGIAAGVSHAQRWRATNAAAIAPRI